MQFLDPAQRQRNIRWAQQVRALAAERSDTLAIEQIDQALTAYHDATFTVTLLGKTKRGKSTLMNALLGRRDDVLAPIDKLPASCAISRFGYAPEEATLVRYRSGEVESIGYADIRNYVTEELNPQNRKGVAIVDVKGPFAGLDPQVQLVDTPGTGSIFDYHDELIFSFIPQSDAVIFLVTARMPIDQEEVELLRRIKAVDMPKVFFAVNRIDETSAEDLRSAIDHNRQILHECGIQVATLHQISAKRAFEGDINGSGVLPLLGDIRTFIGENATCVLDARLKSRVAQSVLPLATGLEVELANCQKSATDLAAETLKIATQKRNILQTRELEEREFLAAWDGALGSFRLRLEEIGPRVESAVARRISTTPLTEINNLSRRVGEQIAAETEENLSEPARQLEQSLRKAAEKLTATYPALSLTGIEAFRNHSTNRGDLLMPTAGGVATAAAGIGFAYAGSAAAAAVAATNAAAISTVAVPSAATGLLSLVPYVGGSISSLGTGVVTMAAPAATAPLWVALSGPIGWTIAGTGLLLIPLAWTRGRLKTKGQLEEAAREHIATTFRELKQSRVNSLQEQGRQIVTEFQVRLDRQLLEAELALERVKEQQASGQDSTPSEDLAHRLQSLLIENHTVRNSTLSTE